MTADTNERYVVPRAIAATPAEIFAVLADPSRHQDTEPTDWVRDAVDATPITGTGQLFGMKMYLEAVGGHYVTHNLITVFKQDKAIAWRPGQLTESGEHDAAGWTWRYDLAPNDEHTDVTLTYDWSATPKAVRDEIGGLPPFPEQFIEQSLEALDRAVH